MKIKRFRIQNYKSIIDSGNCYITNPLTIFAGQNESGKTSILEALEDFSYDKEIRTSAIPISNTPKQPEIEIEFELDSSEKTEIREKFNITIDKLTIIKKENDYFFPGIKEEISILQRKKIEEIVSILKVLENKLSSNDTEGYMIGSTIDYYNSLLSTTDLDIISGNSYSEVHIMDLINHFKSENINHDPVDALNKLNIDFRDKYKSYDNLKLVILEWLPNFIYFDISQDKIPNSVSFSEIRNNSFINDLAKISNLDVDLIQSKEYSKIMGHKETINININNEYKDFWTQEESKLEINEKDQRLFFWIKQNGLFYMPEQRSKGKQWHLSFYVKITANAIEGKKNILLIDEPGLYLHAKAQKDILKKLVKESNKMLIIFTTHSPYLIDPDYLNRIQLVIKNDSKGTHISKIQATADKETLTPILTAIGEDIFAGIHNIDKKNSFIVEGISDYYYLNAFKKLLDNTKECYFVPGCGDNIPAIGSVFFGWGLNPKFILDSDKSILTKKLIEKLDIDEDQIIFISLDKNKTIEDIFEISDFKKFVLNDENALINNTKEYIHRLKLDKVLMAKQFFEKADKDEIKMSDLNKYTKENINFIFDKINLQIKEDN